MPPTLIVHGNDDVVIPAGNADRLARRWPGARVELFEGCAHAVMAQEPQRVAAAITPTPVSRLAQPAAGNFGAPAPSVPGRARGSP